MNAPVKNKPTSLSEVPYLSRTLRSPVIAEVYEDLESIAREQGWSYEEYLAAVLEKQVEAKVSGSVRARIKAAKFGQEKALEEFVFEHQPATPRELISHLATSTPPPAGCAASPAPTPRANWTTSSNASGNTG